MKKIMLTSMAALFVAGAANAANVINDNPLYRPMAGHFYSISAIDTTTEFDDIGISEKFGYGITDKLAVGVSTTVAPVFDNITWAGFGLDASYRALDRGEWKADVFGGVTAAGDNWFDSDFNGYAWNLGVRGGYVAGNWTVAGMFEYTYGNAGMFTWGDEGTREYTLGLMGQYEINNDWNVVAGVKYAIEGEAWTLDLGVNYNIDETMFVGVYGSQDIETLDADWALGVKFGIDF